MPECFAPAKLGCTRTDSTKENLLNYACQNKKRPHLERALFVYLKLNLAVDRRSNHCYWGDSTSGQIEGEVVSVALVHNFHTQVSAVDDISPSVDDATLGVDN